MKKFILLFAFVAGIAGAANAQVVGKAIGLRGGYDSQEVSYQHPIGTSNRLELSLGWGTFGHNFAGFSSVGTALNGVYQKVYDLSTITDGLNWYYGYGGAAIFHSGFFGVGALGQIGAEYNFSFPLQLSLDYRPGIYLLPGTDNLLRFSWNSPCFAARYRF